jgi:DNA repair protein RecO (recombination protein O)
MKISRVFQTEGVVIKRNNSGEADRMITIFTRHHGKIRVIAKGIRKLTSRRRGHLEVFNKVSLTIHRGRVIDSVSEADTVEGWRVVPRSLSVLSHAYYACELIDRLIPEQEPYDDVYARFTAILETLIADPGDAESGRVVDAFAVELLRRLGFLQTNRELTGDQVAPYVESVIEKKLRTPKLLKKIAGR